MASTMPPVRTVLFATIAAAALGSAVAFTVRPARALPGPSVLYVSGMHVDGDKPGATVTLTNTSTASVDFYTITVALLHADGRAAAPPAEFRDPLIRRHSLEIDVGSLVAAYRRTQQVSPFKGPIQVIVRGTSCTDTATCPVGVEPQPFGPGVIQVDARQTEGSVSYDAVWSWTETN